MTRRKILIYLLSASAFSLLLEGVGFYFHFGHSKFFFGEMALLGLVSGFVLLALRFIAKRLLAREQDYYTKLRTQPPVIEARKEDWV